MKIKKQKKIKVLRIIARLNIGGPAIHTILLTAGLDKNKFDSILVTGKTEKGEGNMLFFANEKKIQPIIIPELSRSLNFHNDFIAFWKLYRVIKKEKPSIIHTHTAKAGTLGRLAYLLYKLNIRFSLLTSNTKLVHTFHGHVFHGYFGKMKSAFFILIERLLGLFTHKIIAVSESVRRELIDLKVASPEKIETINLGLELSKYLDIENISQENRNYRSVGIVGRLAPVKNHKMFFDAAKRLIDTSDSRQRIKFFVVGDGSIRPGLENYVERIGIKKNIIFTGWIRDLKKIYSILDIVVLTSLNEGTPVALIEAMAASRPVISTEVGGVKDLLSNKYKTEIKLSKKKIRYYDQGILIDPGDAASLAQAIEELLKNEKIRRKMGETGRNAIYPNYDISRLINDMRIFYINLIGEMP